VPKHHFDREAVQHAVEVGELVHVHQELEVPAQRLHLVGEGLQHLDG